MKKGFTLVELLVVITIMSILTVITVSQFQTARRKASDVARKGDLSGLAKSLQMYFTDYEVFPRADGGRIQLPDDSVAEWGGTFEDGDYVYMKVMPQDKSPRTYCYEVSTDHKKFGLYANLENTMDNDCKTTNGVGNYVCNGVNYCFTIVSPNAQPGDTDLN